MTIVIGYGNPHRGDDAAGPLVARAVRGVEVHADGVQLIHAWAGATRAIVVDAVVSGSPPGTVFHWTADTLPGAVAHPVSSHGLGLAQAIALADQLDLLPDTLEIIGIEASHFEGEVSEPVARAIREVVHELAAIPSPSW